MHVEAGNDLTKHSRKRPNEAGPMPMASPNQDDSDSLDTIKAYLEFRPAYSAWVDDDGNYHLLVMESTAAGEKHMCPGRDCAFCAWRRQHPVREHAS